MITVRPHNPPDTKIFVGYDEKGVPDGWEFCLIGENITFDIEALASYFFKDKSDLSYDAFMLAAAVEYCDCYQKRPIGWSRKFTLNIPVSNPEKWNDPKGNDLLIKALLILTGDIWHIQFRTRNTDVNWPDQAALNLPTSSKAVIAFSDGMDSLAVGKLSKLELGEGLVQLRLGKKKQDKQAPFIAIPFGTNLPKRKKKNAETSGRSRGFKFAILSIVASLLSKTSRIIVPESGQGALGPALVTVSRIHKDYRNHPFFFQTMKELASSLLSVDVSFEIPRIWHTKGETLKKYIEHTHEADKWLDTRSCWRDARFVSINGKKKQCGICAACLLRRMSVHAAGLLEPDDHYVWHDLTVDNFENGSIIPYDKLRGKAAYLKYGRAAVRHLRDLAYLNDPSNLNINAGQIAQAHQMDKQDVMTKQNLLLEKHKHEWETFLTSLGPQSFITMWANAGGRNVT